MQTLLFFDRNTENVFFNDKPIDLNKHVYMFKWFNSSNKGHIFKLVQYSKDGFSWLNIFDNGHWFVNPNGRTTTLDDALQSVSKYNIKIFECKKPWEICEFISSYNNSDNQA